MSGIGFKVRKLLNKFLDFVTGISNPVYKEGRLFYDNVKKALSYYNDEADITINLAQEFLIPVYNNTGSTILNGSLVYPTGVVSGRHTIDLADASKKDKCRFVAMATHDIEDGTTGYVTRLGSVGGLNTSALTDAVYLSATTPGAFTGTRPIDGAYIVRVGAVKEIHGSEGSITLDPYIAELAVEVTDTNGFPPDQRTGTTISFVDGTRTFTIAPTGAEFHYYVLGDKYEKDTGESIVISDTTGLHVFYYDDDTLSTTVNPTEGEVDNLIRTKALVAYVYWNSTTGASYYLGDERHGISMSPNTHAYLHFTRGARYLTGLTLSDMDVDGSGGDETAAQFGVTSGATTDEDVYNGISAVTSTTGLPIFYKLGAVPEWRVITEAGFSVTNTGSVSGRLVYNLDTAGTWSLEEVSSNNDYVLCHVFAINDINNPMVAVMGENQYSNIGDARAGAELEIFTLTTTGLPFEEAVPIATVIFQTSATFSNTVQARVISTDLGDDYIDWRFTESIGGGGTGTTATAFKDLTDTEATITALAFQRGIAGGGQLENVLAENINLSEFDNDFVGYKFACGDETSDLATGTVYTERITRDIPDLTAVHFGVTTAPVGSTIQIDVQKNSVSIYTTKPTIDAGEFTTLTAATAQVLTGAISFSAGDELKVIIDQVGSTTAGKGLKAEVFYNET